MNPAEENEVRHILAKGLCTAEQVEEAQGIQRQMESMGLRPRSVSEVLLEKGYVDAEDLEDVQREITTSAGRSSVAGYEILELLGRGAMGAVYKARQVSLDRTVALKVLDPELAKDEGYARRFIEEARAVARLSHINLVSGIDVGDDEGWKYLVLEYADGITLARILHRGGALDEERALTIAQQVARAVEYAHRHGVLHGDLRPENVILTSDGVAKVCDLGIARRPLIAGEDAERSLRRTPDYVSPEQARGVREITLAADQYGLGAVLFHMLTGRPPFVGDSREAVLARHLTEPAPAARSLAPEVSLPTEAIVARCLQKNPVERYADAAELLRQIDAALTALQNARASGAAPSGGAQAASEPQAPGGPAPVRRRHTRRR